MDQIDYGTLYIKYKGHVDEDKAEEIVKDLKEAIQKTWGVKVEDAKEETEELKKTQRLLDMIFDGCILIVMFLSFFSLSASMSANLYG